MTQIITRATYRSVIQASDRAVTVKGQPYDLLSNKALLCLFRDAIVSIAYTGPAHIQGLPTDQWVAQELAGVTYKNPYKPSSHALGEVGTHKKIGSSLLELQTALNRVLSTFTPRLRNAWRSQLFAVVVDGWQWNSKGHYRPVLYRLVKHSRSMRTVREMKERNWWVTRHIKVIASPKGHLNDKAFRNLVDGLKTSDPCACIAAMASSIKELSSGSSLVGPHSVAIHLPRPTTHKASIHYLPGEDDPAQYPIAYSPWVIGPGYVHAPSKIQGDYRDQIGHWCIEFKHPFRKPKGGYVGGQKRTPPP